LKKLVKYAALQHQNDDQARLIGTGNEPEARSDLWVEHERLGQHSGGDAQVIEFYHAELEKIVDFMDIILQQAQNQYCELERQCILLAKKEHGPEATNPEQGPTQEESLVFLFRKSRSRDRQQLIEAFKQHYHMLVLFDNFRILNEISARKSLKVSSR
jgi:hypothetical protein